MNGGATMFSNLWITSISSLFFLIFTVREDSGEEEDHTHTQTQTQTQTINSKDFYSGQMGKMLEA